MLENTDATVDAADEQELQEEQPFEPVKFTSIMKHLVINRPAELQNVFKQGAGGLPTFREVTPPAIEFKAGVFVAQDLETAEYLRSRGDGRKYGFNVQYFEVSADEVAKLAKERAARRTNKQQLAERVDALEDALEQEVKGKQPAKKSTSRRRSSSKKKLSDTIE